jgi:hypothetical protein
MAKIKLEKDYSKVTVKQYVDFITNEGNDIGQVSAILRINKDDARNLSSATIGEVIAFFKETIDEPKAEHQHKWKGYGFVPDINKISFGEWLDLESNCKEFPKHLTKLLAILYRPISSEIGTKYKIEPYTAEHLTNAKVFDDMPLSVANGAMVFFSNIESELLNRSLAFLDSTMMMEMEKAIAMMKEAVAQQTT